MTKIALLLTAAALALGGTGCATTPREPIGDVTAGPYSGVRSVVKFMVADLPWVPRGYQGTQQAVVVLCVPVLEGVAAASIPQQFVADTWHLPADLRQVTQNQPPTAVTSR